MKLYLKNRDGSVNAIAEYNIETKECVVLSGSIISDTISHSEKFRGAISIEKSRKGNTKNGKVTKDVMFKSASTAANFVTGTSTNGMIAWKTEKGKSLRDYIKEALE